MVHFRRQSNRKDPKPYLFMFIAKYIIYITQNRKKKTFDSVPSTLMKILRQHKIWNNSIARGNKQGNQIIRTLKAERSRKLGIEKREGMFASTN